ncbi:MAG: (4Fe-4S)-binding protein [Lachnospiraceae bacterium]|nr:(4Fe-4S)-binding protein [Lachnospiraceae bacterium]
MHRIYENEDISIFWDSDKCRHAKECVHGSPGAFNVNRRPWIDVNGAPNPEIWQAISKCPSGAVQCVYNHGIRIIFEEDRCRSVAIGGDTEIGECCYREDPGTWTIVHTEVNPHYGGRKIAKRLVYKVIEEAERRKQTIIPACSYAGKVLGE